MPLNRDHDFLANLYKTDPDAFEEYCNKLKEEEFNKLPEERQTKARMVQWNIDKELIPIKDPIARMNRMVELLNQGVKELAEVMEDSANRLNEIQDDINQ